MPRRRPRLLFVAAWLLLSCRPAAEQPDLGRAGDPAPPQAPILETLTDYGILEGDARAGADVSPEGSVIATGPRREATVREPIFIDFSTPMRDDDATGVDFAIDPPLTGESTWVSPTRLVFETETSLQPARRYEVRVAGAATTRGGEPVEVDAAWSFETPRPTVQIEGPSGYVRDDVTEPVQWRRGFDIYLSDPATKSQVRDALTVGHEGQGRLRYRLEGVFDRKRDASTMHWRVRPRGHWPAGALVRATMAESFTSLAGPLSSGQEVFAELRTRDGVAATLDCEHEASDGCVVGEFEINFDEELPASAKKLVTVTPRPKNYQSHVWAWRETFSRIHLYGDFEVDQTYTVRFGKQLRDVHGQSLAGPRTREITFVAPPPTLDLRGSGTQVAMHGGAIGVESRSLEDASLTINTLDDRALASLVQRGNDPLVRPAQGVTSREVELDLTPGGTWGWDARRFDLSKELGSPTGAAFLELAPGRILAGQAGRADAEASNGLVQVTNLGAIVAKSPSGGFIRVLALDTAEPVAGATAHIYGAAFPPKLLETVGTSDVQGFIRLPKGTRLTGGVTHVVVVKTADDRMAMALPGDGVGHWRSWGQPENGAEFDIGVLMPDRELYQPGETMRVMGWTARSTTDNAAGIEGSGTRPVEVVLRDRDDRILDTATVRTKAYGKFWATLKVPESASLGGAEIVATVDGDRARAFTRSVWLREFVAPAFDVSLSLDEVALSHGQSTRAVSRARYLHGMPLPIASVSTRSRCSNTAYQPVDTHGYRVAHAAHLGSVGRGWETLEPEPSHAQGRVTFEVDFGALQPGRPYSCEVSVLAADATRQELAASTTVWVHPSRYLLLHEGPRMLQLDETRTIEAKAVSPSGSATTAAPATVRISRRRDDGDLEKVSTCTMRFDSEGVSTCRWTPRASGSYEIALTGVVDGTEVETVQSVYVYGRWTAPEGYVPFQVNVPEEATVGTTVTIDAQSDHERATAMVVEVHAGIRDQHLFEIRDHTGSFDLEMDHTWVPRGYLDTFVVSAATNRDLPDVDYSFDDVVLGHRSRALEVTVSNAAVSSTGSTLPIDVAVVGLDGSAVENAHVSVWAVDEGILLLRDWSFPDFTAALSYDRGNEARYWQMYGSLRRPYVLRSDPFEPSIGLRNVGLGGGGSGSGHGGGSGRLGKSATSKPTRSNFDPAPIFVGDVKTGADGTARVYGVLPDNLTTFRIAAVATAEVPGTGAFARAGRGESEVRVTQELAVRPVLPRVLRPGDTATLGVLVDNLGERPGALEVEVELRDAHGIARLTSQASITRRLDTPQIRIPVDIAATSAGELQVWVHATLVTDDGRTLEDASELPLEVRVERTLVRHAATYGSFSDTEAGAIALDIPDPRIPRSAAASVDVYASMLGGYAGSVDALVDYPYGCVEQTSSRLVPLAALHGLKDFDLGVENVEAFIDLGVARLKEMQTAQGGFAYWPGGRDPHVFATAYATWVLSELARTGIAVDRKLLEGATDYLAGHLERARSHATPTANDDTRTAMALLAMASMSRPDDAMLDALLERTDRMPTFSRALLAMALHRAHADDPRLTPLLEGVRERVEIRGKTARSRAESKRYTEFFDSPLRTDAMILLALVRAAPDDELIEPLARGLTEARDRGALRNTQEHAYALLAMSDYAALRESVDPDMEVRAWLGPDLLVDTGFEGRDLRVVSARASIASEDPMVTLQRLGEGRLYYRVDMQWAPEPKTIAARARGIAIERAMFDQRGEVEDRPLIAGEAAAMEVVVTADVRQRYVAIEVPLPAGVEAVDRSLGRGGASKFIPTRSRASSLAVSHHELRGDRVLVFVDHLAAGTHRYVLPLRVTHEGLYSVPPATAAAMYAPEIAGNTAGREIRIISK